MTPPNNEPTLGEVLRRLDDYVVQQQKIIERLDRMVNDNAATYVRQDVYVAQEQARNAILADVHGDIQSIKDDRKTDNAFRRQVWLTLGALAISTLVTIAIAITNLLAR